MKKPHQPNHRAIILITGATSGIGRAAALALHRAGHRVFATGRRAAALADLAKETHGPKAHGTLLPGIETLVMDVTDNASIAAAKQEINARTGGYGVDAIVNSAGYGAMGPLEDIDDRALRAQYDTNVFGLMSVTRAFVPQMRARGYGRVVNISSIGGRVAAPLMGAYSSSKYAVEALSDALRVELAPFGVKVVVIQPGSISTEFSDVAVATVPSGARSAYAPAIAATAAISARFAKASVGPEHVTRAIVKALFSRRPAARYIRPWRTYALLVISRLLPTAWLDAIMARLSGLTRRALTPAERVPALRVSQSMGRGMLPLIAVLALLGVAADARAAGGWEKISEQDGVTIERRARPGSAFDELRATATCPVPPEMFFATVWNYRAFTHFVPYLKSLEVLEEKGDRSDVYQQVRMPLVADRDYTLRLHRQSDKDTQVYQMSFDSADEVGPPPHAPFVRAENIHGGWTLEPIDGGKGTLITYRLYSEPGGDVPSWIVNLAQRSAPRDLLLAVTKRVLQTAQSRK